MMERIAYRVSVTALLLTALAIIAMLAMGLTRAIANPSQPVATATAPKVVKAAMVQPLSEKVAPTREAAFQAAAASGTDSPFIVKRILEINEPFVHGVWVWDDEGVPDGELIITVDLKAESMSVFRDGYEIGAAVITFGDSIKPTPTGTFPITQKDADHISNIYFTPMPYMLRLTNDGISIHGTEVEWGWGTRGCIGIPNEFAKLLFEQVKLGDKVIITDGKMMQVG